MVTVITTITTSDHHRIKMDTTIVTNRVTDSISIVPPHHSITFLHPHYLISRMVIAVTSPWTLVLPYVSNVIKHVWLTTNVICSKAETTAITVACKDTSHVSAHPNSNNGAMSSCKRAALRMKT